MSRLAAPFQATTQPRWFKPLGFAVAALAIALATGALLLAGSVVSLGIVYLVYLLLVVLLAAGWGLAQGVFAALLAFLATNFLFVQPLYTFAVASVQDVVALVIFLILATLTSQLMARLRAEAEDARQSQRITATLYLLSQTINRQNQLPALLREVCAQLSAVSGLEDCTVILGKSGGPGAVTAFSGELLSDDPHDQSLIRQQLHIGQRNVGAILLRRGVDRQITPEEKQLLAAFAEQVQVAVERARLQDEATEAQVLRRTDALRTALLSAVAHDLRTPLASIKAAGGSLLSKRIQWQSAERDDFLQAIIGEADHIDRLVHNLLDMARIEAGRLAPHKEPRRVDELISAVLERLAPRLEGREIIQHVAPGVPMLMLDEVEIDEAFTNLLENALKYTPNDSPIEINVRQEDGFVVVEIEDRGPGVPAQDLPLLFDRFYRVQASNNKAIQGTGLGLAIVKGIIEAHGGHVGATNREGGGAVFSFTLPIAEQQ